MYLSLLLFALFSHVTSITDNILMPYDRFQYDLEKFIPVVEQEMEFAELSGLTDDVGFFMMMSFATWKQSNVAEFIRAQNDFFQQAFEQIKTFFPTLQLRIQQMRNTGIIADLNRASKKEGATQMCGQGHQFAYLLVDHKLRNIQQVLVRKRITAANNLKMLTEVKSALVKWGESSKFPCKIIHPKGGK